MSAIVSDIHSSIAVNIDRRVPRDQYLDYVTFHSLRPPMLTEIFGPLIGLKEEWAQQGASPGELDLSAYRFDRPMKQGVAASTGWMGGEQEEVLENNAQHLIYRDRMGRRMKLIKGYATLALPLDYPVRNMDDWRRISHHYEFSEQRFFDGWAEDARRAREAGWALTVSIPGGFDEPRQLMGEEELCVSLHTQPDLIANILQTIGDTACRVLDRVSAEVQIDELSVHEDMAGKSGPLVGPSQIREFIQPYYRRVWDMLHERGARVFIQDSDGNMNPVIESFIECGVNLMYPMEPAAGMNIVKLREQYGTRLAFVGGIDKHVLRRSREDIVRELEYKIPPMVRTGGCILGLDHRIPNGTPLDNYRFYVSKAWEIIDREAALLPHLQ